MASWLRHIWEQLRSDRRKLFLLSAVLVLGMLFWGRLIFLRKVPRTAVADPDAKAAAAASGVAGHAAGADGGGDNPSGRVDLLDRPVVEVAAPMSLRRDLFAFEGHAFELITPSSPGSPAQRKYGQSRADNEQLLRELKSRYDRMQLQTTFLAAGEWTAMIDGRFRKAGDAFDGFKIVEVRPRQVLLEVQGIRVWLKMDKE